MRVNYNRFAILPHTCSKCEKSFWLEPYKRYKIEHFSMVGCVEYITSICKGCSKALEQMQEKGERMESEEQNEV